LQQSTGQAGSDGGFNGKGEGQDYSSRAGPLIRRSSYAIPAMRVVSMVSDQAALPFVPIDEGRHAGLFACNDCAGMFGIGNPGAGQADEWATIFILSVRDQTGDPVQPASAAPR
jgi:hypothetical protein